MKNSYLPLLINIRKVNITPYFSTNHEPSTVLIISRTYNKSLSVEITNFYFLYLYH